MVEWFNQYWKDATRSEKAKNLAFFFAIMVFVPMFLSPIVRTQSSAIVSYILDKAVLLFGGVFLFTVSLFYRIQYDESIDTSEEAKVDGPRERNVSLYPKETSELITCSHNLDKVRSNLRTGVIFIFGISAALLVWIFNYGSIFDDSPNFLVVGSASFTFITLIAILFSFSNPIARLGLNNIGEGLVSMEMDEMEYKETLFRIIQEKEHQLWKMRSVMQFGIISFLMAVFVTILSFWIYQPIPVADNPIMAAVLQLLNMLSFISVLIGVMIALIVILGRAFFGLTD